MKFSTGLCIVACTLLATGCGSSSFDILNTGSGTGGNGALGVDGGGNGNDGGNSGAGNGTGNVPNALNSLRTQGTLNANGDLQNSTQAVSNLCNSRNRQRKNIDVNFAIPGQSCDWNNNGNLQPRNFFFQARAEQFFTIDLPAGAVICDMDFQFPAEQFQYDDQFLLSLNDTVLTSSFDYSSLLPGGGNGLTLYNWDNIAGTNWNFERTNQYCATLPDADSSCVFPDSSQSGVSDMEFETEHIMTAMANGVPAQGQHFFRLSTIGDNDVSDCGHAGLNFGIQVDYVQ